MNQILQEFLSTIEIRLGHLSFRHQVAAIAIALGMVPTLTVGIVSYRLNDHAVNQAIELQQLSAKMTSDAVQNYIRQRQVEMSAIAALPMLNDARVWDSLPIVPLCSIAPLKLIATL